MRWLFLVHQVQTPNSRERVKVWRMTKKVGAILYRNSVYVLPHSKERLEDFQWLAQQIRDSQGDASVFVTDAQDEKEDALLRRLFTEAKKEEYTALLRSISAFAARARRGRAARGAGAAKSLAKEFARLQEEFAALQRTDFFGHPLATEAAEGLKDASVSVASLRGGPDAASAPRLHARKDFQGKTWSTREHIHIDRVCSAWLIRRFIDPKAKFVFAPESKLPKGTIPFDVVGAEFGHRGDRCSFESLLRGFQIKDPVLDSIAEIVHDIDLKDQKFGRPEASGVDLVIRSLSDSLGDDRKALEVGSVVLDGVYHYIAARM